MYLIRLLYASKTQENFGPNEISSILDSAAKHNKRVNVTGCLYFNNKYFLQCLEGSRSVVNKLYQEIVRDDRHTDIIILDYHEIKEREFEQWSMGYVPQTALTDGLNMKYSSCNTFNPYEMSGKSALKLMVDLKKYV